VCMRVRWDERDGAFLVHYIVVLNYKLRDGKKGRGNQVFL